MAELTENAAVRRLTDRYGFGLGGDRLVEAQDRGLTATVAELLRPSGTDAGLAQTPAPELAYLPRPRAGAVREKPGPEAKKAWRREQRRRTQQVQLWWLDRMVAAEQPTTERLTWLWHGHFATSSQKVKDAASMLGQNQTQRRLARGSFTALAQAMVIDPALLFWLDGNNNTAKAPNENLSREFMELFTLGPGGYAEADVREAARALTGWKINRTDGSAVLRPRLHDRSNQQILGREADFDAESFVALVLDQSASANFVTSRVWFRLVSMTPPSAPVLARLRAAYGAGRDITALLTAIAAEPDFRSPTATLVKQPVEWAVGLMRAVGVRPSQLTLRQHKQLLTTLRGMGQAPLLPPSVGGWPAGGAWLTTAAALSRVEAARLIAQAAPLSASALATSRRARPELVRRMLGVERFSARTLDAVDAVDDLPLAIAVAACSPEYVVSA